MKQFSDKLKSKRGASIVLALVFFLVCAAVGAVLLTGAMTNAGRLSHMEEEQQAYLTLSSAVKLVQAELDGMEYKGEVITVNDNTSSATTDTYIATPENSLSELVKVWADCYFLKTPEPSENFTIQSELEEVNVAFTMNDEYAIEAIFTMNGSSCTMTLTVSASATSGESKKEDWIEGPGGLKLETTVTKTTAVKWLDGKIVKGGGNG